jgi:hypothetical protein
VARGRLGMRNRARLRSASRVRPPRELRGAPEGAASCRSSEPTLRSPTALALLYRPAASTDPESYGSAVYGSTRVPRCISQIARLPVPAPRHSAGTRRQRYRPRVSRWWRSPRGSPVARTPGRPSAGLRFAVEWKEPDLAAEHSAAFSTGSKAHRFRQAWLQTKEIPARPRGNLQRLQAAHASFRPTPHWSRSAGGCASDR